jgi:hypothetical protein
VKQRSDGSPDGVDGTAYGTYNIINHTAYRTADSASNSTATPAYATADCARNSSATTATSTRISGPENALHHAAAYLLQFIVFQLTLGRFGVAQCDLRFIRHDNFLQFSQGDSGTSTSTARLGCESSRHLPRVCCGSN